MSDGRCRSCSFWKSPSETSRAPEGFGDCSCPKYKMGYRVDEADSDGVVVEGDEGWGFVTGPEFGCVHWNHI